jgi:FKBP-type peptidyl-prolyl cis-trans isomerase FklB
VRSRRRSAVAGLAIALTAAGCGAGELLDSASGRASYSLGHQIGVDLARQGRAVDAEALRQGLRDALADRPPALTAAEMNDLLVGLKRRIVANERGDRIRGASSLRRRGEEFMAANARQEGVVALPSGVQYRAIEPGTGPRPTATDRVIVRYRSTRLDGTLFHDSMRDGTDPETLHVSGVIRGLTEVLQLMPVGARWQVFLPPEQAFGRRGPLADHTVIYDVLLIAIGSDPTAAGKGGG